MSFYNPLEAAIHVLAQGLDLLAVGLDFYRQCGHLAPQICDFVSHPAGRPFFGFSETENSDGFLSPIWCGATQSECRSLGTTLFDVVSHRPSSRIISSRRSKPQLV